MAHDYHFPPPSLLSRVLVAKNASERVEATLYAAPCEETHLLQRLPRLLARHGLACYADEEHGLPVLRVTGFGRKEQEVISALQECGVIKSPGTSEELKDGPTSSVKERFRKNTVRLSGLFGDLGHGAMIASGFINHDYHRVFTASTYLTATTLQAAYGNGAGGIPFARMMHDLRGYFAKEGLTLPEPQTRTPEVALGERTLSRKMGDWIKSHPLEISNTLGLLGNLSLLRSGLHAMKLGGAKAGVGRAVSGGFGAIGTVVAIAVPEASEEEKKGMRQRKSLGRMIGDGQWSEAIKESPQRLFDLVRRSPLAVLGGLNLINNAGLLHAAIEERQTYKTAELGGVRTKWKYGFIKDGVETVRPHAERIKALQPEIDALQKATMVGKEGAKNFFKLSSLRAEQSHLASELNSIKRFKWGWMFAAATAVLYPVASLMMALSSKKRDKSLESKEAYGEMYAYAANMIIGLPAEKQKRLIDKMSEYLAVQPDVKVKADEIRGGIAGKLAAIATGPWGPSPRMQLAGADERPLAPVINIATRRESVPADPSIPAGDGDSKLAPVKDMASWRARVETASKEQTASPGVFSVA